MVLTTETKEPPVAGNLPLPVSSAFTGDDLGLIFGTCLPCAAFVVDRDSGVLAGCNQRFGTLVAGDPYSLEAGLSWEGFLVPEDRSSFATWGRGLTKGGHSRVDFRLLKADGGGVPVQAVVTSFLWRRRSYLLGFVSETVDMDGREVEWKRQLEEQKLRAIEAIKSSLRLYQLNEKIRRTPNFTRKLLHAGSEAELFAEAAKVLTSEEGLCYRDAAFLLVEGDVVNVVFSTRAEKVRAYPLAEENRFSCNIRNGFRTAGGAELEILVPLQSHGQLLGFCEVVPHSREKVFFDESGVVSEWQKDVLFDVGGIIALILDNLRLNREIKRQSLIDPLTQAYNRHYFVDRLTSEVERAARYARPVSILFVDLDDFKLINDKYGHLQGDEVLRMLGKLFTESLRDVDVVCRYGGDEFVILLPETETSMALPAAEKLLRSVRSHAFSVLDDPARTLSVTISIGLSTLRAGQSDDALLKAADAALYRAKSLGRNRVEVFI